MSEDNTQMYRALFRVHGMNNTTIKSAFLYGTGTVKREIEYLAEKYRILLEVKLTGKIPKFDNYSKNDYQLERNVENYCRGLYLAVISNERMIIDNLNFLQSIAETMHNCPTIISKSILDDFERLRLLNTKLTWERNGFLYTT